MKSLAFTLATALAVLPSAASASGLVNCSDAAGEIISEFLVSQNESRRVNSDFYFSLGGAPGVTSNSQVAQFKFSDSELYLLIDDPNTATRALLELTGTRREANVYRAQLRRFDNGTLIAPVLNLICTVTPL
ncbi:MAG: hypothetical protein SF069_04420 [Phycisphaerae bacterium]|nr:hypothetical protein [Phycisphaerae bacterium]